MTVELQQISDYWVLLGKVRTTCQLLCAKQRRYVMAEGREEARPVSRLNFCFN